MNFKIYRLNSGWFRLSLSIGFIATSAWLLSITFVLPGGELKWAALVLGGVVACVWIGRSLVIHLYDTKKNSILVFSLTTLTILIVGTVELLSTSPLRFSPLFISALFGGVVIKTVTNRMREDNRSSESLALRADDEPTSTKADLFHQIFVRSEGKTHRIDLTSLLYAEANGNYVKLFIGQQMIKSTSTFSSLTNVLPESTFVRCHRSFVVNICMIDFVEGNRIYVGKHQVPIGESYREILMNRLHVR